jgi:uncharacterized SAM-binding protein YcdF (DUF218 family)
VFWLKKLVSSFLMPLPLCLALLACGLVLCTRSRQARLGRLLILGATALLFIFSNRLVSTRLLRPLEERYPPIPEIAPGALAPATISSCRFVVVLGSGHSEMPGMSATSQLSASGLARIVEAVRILRAVPKAQLIVSGPGEAGHPTHASILALAAESLGIDSARITLIDTARDTEDESFAVHRLVGEARIALITSAWHMPRAAHLFRKADVNFVPCPSDFVSSGDILMGWNSFGWDTESLGRSTRAVHEWIGLLWLRLRGA